MIVKLIEVSCYDCGIHFGLDEDIIDRWTKSEKHFHCPNGHPNKFTNKSADKLQLLEKENKELKEKLEAASKELEALHLELEIWKPNTQLNKDN